MIYKPHREIVNAEYDIFMSQWHVLWDIGGPIRIADIHDCYKSALAIHPRYMPRRRDVMDAFESARWCDNY